MNEKFSRPARSSEDAHVNLGKVKLDNILCMEFGRRISKDHFIRFQARLFQILNTNKPLPRTEDKVLVRIPLDNAVHIIWRDKPLLVKEIPLCSTNSPFVAPPNRSLKGSFLLNGNWGHFYWSLTEAMRAIDKISGM